MAEPTQITGISVSIGPQYNTIAAPRRWETRVVVLTWRSRGQTYRRQIPYKIVPFLNHSTTPDQVRAYLGLGSDDLPDEDVDVSQAYYRLEDEIGAPLLTSALASGQIAEIYANEAILTSAVVLLLPSLRLRATQTRQNGDIRASRFSSIDFNRIGVDAESRRALAISKLQGTKGVAPSLLALSSPPNPFPLRYLPRPNGAGFVSR